MWIKNLFSTKQIQQKPNQDKSVIFQTQQLLEESSPLIDLSPDIRYHNIDPKLKNVKTPFPHNIIHQSESIIFCKIQQQDGFQCRSSCSNFTFSKLICTDKQLIITPNIFCSQINTRSLNSNYFDLPLGQIQKIQIKQVKKQSLKLHLILKDNREIIFTNKLGDSLKYLHEIITKFALVNGINKLFAFNYRKRFAQNVEKISKGWEVYNFRNQFLRQGAFKYSSLDQKEKDFKYAYKLIKNHSFDISSTYPPQFLVPFNISIQQLTKSTKFRTRQRIPALTYFYEYKSQSYSTLFRCSQIKSGLMGNRCQQDQKIIKQIAISSNFISKTKKIYLKHNIKIYDARGFYAALGNMFAGKGYQKQQAYNCDIQFLNIPNIHAVRDSYIKIKNADSNTQQLYEAITSSGWIEYLVLILAGSKQMAYDLMNGKNVLVHCSDGWDRTSQLSSLCQLLLDPYYRTLQGIAVLIQKDWRYFGHKFRQRTGQYHPTNYHPYQKSPVFIQFLDCIFQIQCQYPLSFQYNSCLLNFLAKHVNSCVYGSFLTNNMKQASQVKIQHQTISIWTDILYGCEKQLFMNPFYRQDLNSGFLNVNLDIKNMKIWKQHLFNQKDDFQVGCFSYLKQKLINKALREQLQANQKVILQLKGLLKSQES